MKDYCGGMRHGKWFILTNVNVCSTSRMRVKQSQKWVYTHESQHKRVGSLSQPPQYCVFEHAILVRLLKLWFSKNLLSSLGKSNTFHTREIRHTFLENKSITFQWENTLGCFLRQLEQNSCLPSLFMPICKHFFSRHAWHWFRWALSTMHRPVPAWHL